MKPKVFVTRILPEEGLTILRETAEVKVWEGEVPPPYDVVLNEAREADGIISLLTDRIDRNLLDAATKLKVISNYAVGFDNIDIASAAEKGIYVTNTPGVLTETTADLAFTLMMTCARRIVESQEYVRAGKWKTWSPTLLLGQDIYGSTLGLVGLGRIGAAVTRRARGFGMKILYYDICRNQNLEKELGITYCSLEDLLKNSDFVSLHVPLTDSTRGMINRDKLAMMKKTAILVNTARGPIVREDDLYHALKEGIIWAAGLDVTDPEPISPGSPLLKLDNVVIVPHIASASIATRTKMSVMAAKNLLAVLQGEEPPNPVNKPVNDGRIKI